MDHTVYERKNTDLGSTSMTKSGGFSIKKRHRKLGALIGLAALAVPFAANLGTLGDAIHAVTGPQNVYESELLNVKLKTSQDKTKTTWDLEFDRSETSVSEQTVKFKLDLDKAGLKDAEIKQDDKALDMREGIVSAVLKSQSTHLILTAISTNEDKHDITLPVTELGLYDDKNGENKLPVDNRSVDLTMAFEKVAEIAKESSSSETVTEAVAKEEEKSEDKQGEKTHRVVPNPNQNKGYIPLGTPDPAATLRTSLSTQTQVQLALIDPTVRTTPDPDTKKTDGENFQIWSSDANNTAYNPDNDSTRDNTKSINIYQKFDVADMKIDGDVSENTTAAANVRQYYHNQYNLTSSDDNNQSAYTIEFTDDSVMQNASFEVFYDNVGHYVDIYGVSHQMGAVMTISRIKPTGDLHQHLGNMRFIDLPNNIYSGLLYHGIDSLDIQVEFYESNEGTFSKLLNLDGSQSRFTFASLNNFGYGDSNSWTGTDATNWNVNATGISTSTFAESVVPLTANHGIDTTELGKGQVVGPSSNPDKENSAMKLDTVNNKWYSTAHGNYNWSTVTIASGNWEDNLANSTTFQMGSVSYSATGTAGMFRLYTGTGNTWQTLTCANNQPLQLNAPRKLVTRDNLATTAYASYTEALSQLNSTENAAATQKIINDARTAFVNEWGNKAYTTDFYIQRENAVTKALTDNNVAYGNMYDKDLAITATTLSDGEPYFTYDYWVMQPTYKVPGTSLVKPQSLVISDILPKEVLLEDVKLADTANTSSSVRLFDTAGNLLVQGTDYNVLIEPNSDDTQQTVVVTLTEAGIAKIDFNGANIALDLDVRIAAHVTDDGVRHDQENIANVTTTVTEKAGGINTNEVKTHLVPHGSVSLEIVKYDDKGNKLNNAEFTLTRVQDPIGWDGDKFNGWENIEPVPMTLREGTGVGSNFAWDGLKIGKYVLKETDTPGGYQSQGDVTFYVNGKLDANKDEILEYIEGDDDYSVKVVNDWTSNDAKTEWSGNIINPQNDVNIELYKIDSDKQPLDGAGFTMYEYVNGAAVASTKQDFTDVYAKTGATADIGKFVLPENVFLDYGKIYVIQESTHPSGYAMIGDIYFQVVPKNEYSSYTDVPGTAPTGDVAILQVTSGGAPIQWLETKPDSSNVFTGKYNVQNDAKLIFPRVGGTGIQAYIGAGVIIMLIAGGAAWYIKRRQNQ